MTCNEPDRFNIEFRNNTSSGIYLGGELVFEKEMHTYKILTYVHAENHTVVFFVDRLYFSSRPTQFNLYLFNSLPDSSIFRDNYDDVNFEDYHPVDKLSYSYNELEAMNFKIVYSGKE